MQKVGDFFHIVKNLTAEPPLLSSIEHPAMPARDTQPGSIKIIPGIKGLKNQ
jgi:hypothetical protein